MSSEIQSDDFTRRFALRSKNLMWLLGAGASAAAGLPTAMDMVWRFKRALFLSQNRGSSQASVDLSQPAVRSRIEAHTRSLEGIPVSGAPNEYASLFEAAYPAESDRQRVLDGMLTGAKPSYGHMAVATLMHHRLTRIVWTTNFDTLIADACAKVFGTTGALTTIDLDTAVLAEQTIANERWPIEFKLHGDFRSRRLKNTDDELRQQDAHLRKTLVDACRRHGLVVCGYSGRDDSVMDALEEAATQPGAFPAGLFWLYRGHDAPLQRVRQLLDRGIENEIEVALVIVESFDEALRDLIHLSDDLDISALQRFGRRRPWSPAPLFRSGRERWPIVRLNALSIVDAPTQCRRVDCSIGGTAEVRDAVQNIGVDVLAVRSQIGVLAFGVDADVRKAFDSHGITDFDLHAFDVNRQRYESSERGLLGEALNRAISRHRGLKLVQRWKFVPEDPSDGTWDSLRQLVGPLIGVVGGNPELRWREGITVRLDWANDQVWLLFDPCTVFEGVTDDNRAAAVDLARERSVRRYNKKTNDLIDFWARHLSQGESEMRAFNTGSGIDAVFRLSSLTGFSWRRAL